MNNRARMNKRVKTILLLSVFSALIIFYSMTYAYAEQPIEVHAVFYNKLSYSHLSGWNPDGSIMFPAVQDNPPNQLTNYVGNFMYTPRQFIHDPVVGEFGFHQLGLFANNFTIWNTNPYPADIRMNFFDETDGEENYRRFSDLNLGTGYVQIRLYVMSRNSNFANDMDRNIHDFFGIEDNLGKVSFQLRSMNDESDGGHLLSELSSFVTVREQMIRTGTSGSAFFWARVFDFYFHTDNLKQFMDMLPSPNFHYHLRLPIKNRIATSPAGGRFLYISDVQTTFFGTERIPGEDSEDTSGNNGGNNGGGGGCCCICDSEQIIIRLDEIIRLLEEMTSQGGHNQDVIDALERILLENDGVGMENVSEANQLFDETELLVVDLKDREHAIRDNLPGASVSFDFGGLNEHGNAFELVQYIFDSIITGPILTIILFSIMLGVALFVLGRSVKG